MCVCVCVCVCVCACVCMHVYVCVYMHVSNNCQIRPILMLLDEISGNTENSKN